MRRLVVSTFLTLDGVMQAPGGPAEDRAGDFAHGGWSVNYWDAAMEEVMGAAVSGPFDMLLGRRTYEIMAAHWPHAEDPGADIFNGATKYVVTNTLERADWQNTRVLNGSLPGAVSALKAQDGPELQVHGSSELIQGLLEFELVDELRLMIFPLVLGTGKRLFGRGTVPAWFEVAEARTSSTGVFLVRYERTSPVPAGSFALE